MVMNKDHPGLVSLETERERTERKRVTRRASHVKMKDGSTMHRDVFTVGNHGLLSAADPHSGQNPLFTVPG